MTARVLARQSSRYLLTGGTAALVDVSLFWLATVAGIAVGPAALLSFLIATVVNYRLTARYVFSSTAGWRGYAKFLAAASLGLVVNVTLTGLLAAATSASPVLAKIGGIGAAFVLNFLMNAWFVFRSTNAR